MTQNPFGDEGFDLGAMLEQAQQVQAQLMQAQADLANQEVEGNASGVRVTLNGVGDLTGVGIPAGTFDGADPDSVADLEDLVVAAYRDAKAKVDALAASALGPLSTGFGLGG